MVCWVCWNKWNHRSQHPKPGGAMMNYQPYCMIRLMGFILAKNTTHLSIVPAPSKGCQLNPKGRELTPLRNHLAPLWRCWCLIFPDVWVPLPMIAARHATSPGGCKPGQKTWHESNLTDSIFGTYRIPNRILKIRNAQSTTRQGAIFWSRSLGTFFLSSWRLQYIIGTNISKDPSRNTYSAKGPWKKNKV